MKKNKKIFLILGIIFVAANLRMPINMIPALLKQIETNVGVPSSMAGMLTSIPLLTFAIMSPVMVKIGKKFGNELTVLLLLGLLVLGSFMRAIPTAIALFLGTFLIGVGITGGNVLIPAVIKKEMPTKIALGTSIYTMSMMFFGAVGTGLSGYLITKISLSQTIMVIASIGILGLISWLPNTKITGQKNDQTKLNVPKYQSVWTQKIGWLVLIMFGLQSLISYSLITWVPTILMSKGIDQVIASNVITAFQLAGIPFSFIAPFMAEKKAGLRWMIIINFVGFVGGISMLLLPNLGNFAYLTLGVIIGFASSIAFNLSIVFFGLKTTNPYQTAELSGMAQAGGYLLAAIGPVSFGLIQAKTGSWNLVIYLLVLLSLILTGIVLVLSRNQKIKE